MSEFDFITYVAQPFVLALMIVAPIVLFYEMIGSADE